MKTEYVLKRQDGSQVMISVVSYHDMYNNNGEVTYRWDVKTRAKGKRKWEFVVDMQSYRYRALSMPDRKSYEKTAHLEVVTQEEVLNAMTRHWEQMKPNMEDVTK